MKITYKGMQIEVNEKKSVFEILKDEIDNSENEVLLCKCNNEIKRLDYVVDSDCEIELLDVTSKEGIHAYIKLATYIMSKAIYETYKDALISVNYQLDYATFCKLDNMEITQEMINNIKNRMKEIIEQNIELKKVVMTQEEAKEFYEKEKVLRGILQTDIKERDEVILYYCEDYYNYFYGEMPLSTGYIKAFDIMKYRDGFLLRYPDVKNIYKLEPYTESKKKLAKLKEYSDIYKVLEINTIYRLNKKIEKDNAKNTILLAEALHEKKIAEIAENIARDKEKRVILIAGPSSSGKTTFAKRLGIQLMLKGLKPVTLSVDNYFVERADNPKDENGEYDFECIEALDLDLFNNHVSRLLAGETVEIPTFDFSIGHKDYKGDFKTLKENEVLVIEGIHALNDKLTEAIPSEKKYKIFINALTVLNTDYYNYISTRDIRLIRRIVRDSQFRNYGAEETLKMWESVTNGEKKYILPFQEASDIMFNSTLIYELAALKKYALPQLLKIDKTSKFYSDAQRLSELLQYVKPISTEYIPKNSLLREFVGGSIFEE